MKNQFVEILEEILKLPAENLTARFDDAAIWDSLQRVEIIFALEDEFSVQFNEEELAESTTPKRLYDALSKKVG